MRTRARQVLWVGALLLAGCGQKGALYLPDKHATVVSAPASPAAQPVTPAAIPPAAAPPADKKTPDDDTQPK
jgi:predicted small lipoprotein YifL